MPWQEAPSSDQTTPRTGGWQATDEQPTSWLDTAKNVGRTADDAVRAAANAVTFGMADRLAGAVPIPGFDVGQGTDTEVKKSEAARERSPRASFAGDVAGAVALPAFGAEALAARYGGGLLARSLAYGGTGAATGAAQGAGHTYTGNAEDYAKNALMGGVLGGALGGVMPMAFKSIGGVAGAAQLPRLLDPDKIAIKQMEELARTAGLPIEEVVKRVRDANAAGQPFTVADALGKEGQRKLTAMAKVPGPQRDDITQTLMARDLNMPNRVGAEVGQALDAPGSAASASEQLIDQAGRQSAPVYRAAERIPTWSPHLQEFIDDPISRQGLAHGVELQRLQSVGSDRPFNPRDAMITGFNEAGDPIITGVPNMQTLHTLKVGLDHMVQGEINPVTQRLTARGNAINGFKNRMLEEIDAENPTYAEARRLYGGPMEVNQAVRAGQEMPTRGRAEDTVRTFNALPPTAQQGVRIGYADAVRNPLERTGNLPTILREKSIKGANELDALSLYHGPDQPGAPSQLRQRLNREETMQRTSKQALGGSATVENAADVANTPGAQEILGVMGNLAAGRVGAAGRSGVELLGRYGRGENEAQRVAITRRLMETNPDMVQEMADRIAERQRRSINPFISRGQ